MDNSMTQEIICIRSDLFQGRFFNVSVLDNGAS